MLVNGYIIYIIEIRKRHVDYDMNRKTLSLGTSITVGATFELLKYKQAYVMSTSTTGNVLS
jgi:hypothetical protein